MSVRNLTALSASNQKGHACCKFDPPKSLTVFGEKAKNLSSPFFLMAVFSVRISQRAFKYVQIYTQVDKRDFLF